MSLKNLFRKATKEKVYLKEETVDLSQIVFDIIRSTATESGVAPELMDITLSMKGLEIVLQISKKEGA